MVVGVHSLLPPVCSVTMSKSLLPFVSVSPPANDVDEPDLAHEAS